MTYETGDISAGFLMREGNFFAIVYLSGLPPLINMHKGAKNVK